MLEQMVNNAIKKTMAAQFGHLSYPSTVCARVQTVEEYDEKWYRYILKIIDKFGTEDKQYPAIPEVYHRSKYEAGTLLAVAFLYGELDPFILGEVKP